MRIDCNRQEPSRPVPALLKRPAETVHGSFWLFWVKCVDQDDTNGEDAFSTAMLRNWGEVSKGTWTVLLY